MSLIELLTGFTNEFKYRDTKTNGHINICCPNINLCSGGNVMVFDDNIPLTRPTEEEVIMKTNSDIISYLSEALSNVETGKDSDLLLSQLQKHSDLLLCYSEKLIQSQRVDIRSVK